MDAGTIGSLLVAFLGGGSVVNVVNGWRKDHQDRKYKVQDQLDERRVQQGDVYRDALRHAHTQFVSSCSKQLRIGEHVCWLTATVLSIRKSTREEAFERGADEREAEQQVRDTLSDEARKDVRQAWHDLGEASSEVEIHGTEWLLLESDSHVQELIIGMLETNFPAPHTQERFNLLTVRLEERRVQFAELVRVIKGRMAHSASPILALSAAPRVSANVDTRPPPGSKVAVSNNG